MRHLHLTLARLRALVPAAALALLLAGCGDDGLTDPTEVELGETTFVFLVNPPVNDASQKSVPTPGPEREGVEVAVEDGPSGTTDALGAVALAPVDPGTRSVSFDDGSNADALSLEIDERDLREVAVALDEGEAGTMASVVYAFGGEVAVITPDMSVEDVNDALGASNQIVLVEGGTYTGDLVFSGSNVTLFGEGTRGGNVTLDGNVEVSGSQNRLRGARVTGDLTISGSSAGVSFSAVAGALLVEGSDARLLGNAFCGDVTVEGSGVLALGNAGMAPVPPPPGGC